MEASRSVGAGGELVEQLIGAIDDINQHAHAMADIIAVMDSIAFQTNIPQVGRTIAELQLGAAA